MVARPQPPPIEDDGDLSLVLRAAQAALEHEFEIAERLDAKARALLTITGAWYAVVVGITGTVLTRSTLPEHPYAVAILVLAIAAVLLLVGVGYWTFKVWGLQEEEELAPRALLEMAAVARDPSDDLASKLVDSYANLLASKRETNKTRAHAFRKATHWSGVALGAAAGQLVVVVLTLVYG